MDVDKTAEWWVGEGEREGVNILFHCSMSTRMIYRHLSRCRAFLSFSLRGVGLPGLPLHVTFEAGRIAGVGTLILGPGSSAPPLLSNEM